MPCFADCKHTPLPEAPAVLRESRAVVGPQCHGGGGKVMLPTETTCRASGDI